MASRSENDHDLEYDVVIVILLTEITITRTSLVSRFEWDGNQMLLSASSYKPNKPAIKAGNDPPKLRFNSSRQLGLRDHPIINRPQ